MAWNNDQVSRVETDKIVEIAQKCVEIPGDFVEMGCYKGDTSLLLAEVLKGKDKKLWIYDSFEGLPEKTDKDESAAGESFKGGELYVSKREAKERFLRANLPLPVIKKAWFGELIDADLPEKIAFAFLDGDFYESIRDSLRLVEKKMVDSGVIVVHDYNNLALPGVARAVDEWVGGGRYSKMVIESMIIIKKDG